MADELDPVEQQFLADTSEYEAALDEASATAQEFADANEEAKLAVDGLRDSSAEAAGAVEGVGLSADETRDRLAEVAAAAGIYRDELGKLRDSQGKFFAESALMKLALTGTRDEALEAAAAMHELRDSEAEAGAAAATAGAEMDLAGAGGISMMVVGIIALIGLLAAVAPAVVAAGGALGAFGLFALPALKSVSGAYTQISADQQAYNRALTASAKSTALAHLKADYAALSPAQAGAVKGIQQLVGEYHNLSKAFAPEAFSILNQALKIAADLLPKLVPLAQAGGKALQGIMDAIGKGVNSKGFSDFLTMLEQLSGPSTSALIGLAGTIGGVLVSALEQLAPYAVPMIKMLQGLVHAAGPALIGALVFLAQTLMDVGKAITPILGPLGKFFGYLDKHPVFAQIAAGIIGMVGALRIFAGVMAIVDAVSAANPFVLIAIALVALAILVATHTHQIAAAFDVVRHAVAELGHDVAAHFDEIRHDIAQWAGDVHHDVDEVADWFRALPGRILAELEALPGQLLHLGEMIIQGLWQGIKYDANQVLSWVEGFGHNISNIFSSALSIFSPSRVFFRHGVNTLQGYIDGVKSLAPTLLATMRGIGGSVATGGLPGVTGGGAAGGSGASHATVNISANFAPSMSWLESPQFLQYMQRTMQEAVLRYSLSNPTNGLSMATGRR